MILYVILFSLSAQRIHASSSSNSFSESSNSSSDMSSSSSSNSDSFCTHSTKKTTDNFFPYARFIGIPILLCDNSSFSLFSEIGPKNYRVNGSIGFFTSENYRFKVGAEYLDQKFHYRFLDGHHHRWIKQWAVGGTYQYWLEECDCGHEGCGCTNWIQGVQVGVNYSHALSKRLHDFFCGDKILVRSTSASEFWCGETGLVFAPWECSHLLLGISYDNIRYGRHHQGSKRLSGIGFCLDYVQKVFWDILFDVKAQFKRPYNYVEALFNWNKRFQCGDFSLGVFGSYVWGNDKLPNSSSVGAELRFAFGIKNWTLNQCVSCDPCTDTGYFADTTQLAAWVANPAVYRPQALSITDERFKRVRSRG